MATKSKGVGRGGSRPGAGRKPKAAPPTPDALAAAEAHFAGKSVDDLMELAVRIHAAYGQWSEVSKAGARLLAARSRQAAPAGKKAQRQSTADALTQTSRFAPPPPPTKPN